MLIKNSAEMDFDKEGDDIILLLLLASGATNLLSIVPKLRRQLVWLNLGYSANQQKAFIITFYRN